MNRIIKIFGYQFYVKEMLVILFTYLLMENIFSWLVAPNSVIELAFEKGMSLLIFSFVLYNFTNLKRNEKMYVGLFCFVIIRLVFESLFKFSKPFEQLTMFTILFPVVYTIFIKCICRSLELDLLEFLAKFYISVYVIFMIIYGRGFSFSLASVDMADYGPFSGDSRIIHAHSILMMIIPLLWYFSKFLETKKLNHLFPFAFCFIVIVIHQHRSVWASAIVAMVIFLIATIRNKQLTILKFFNIMAIALAVGVFAVLILSIVSPGFTGFLSNRFSEIFNPTQEGGTGRFRADQSDIYLALFTKKPIFGWTFEGFEMSNPLVDWWPEKSGQHFHEGYVEMLFYEGIIGLLLKYWFLIYLSFKAFSKRLSRDSIILIAFSVSGLVFSFSYVLTLIFWGHVGLCLYYLEKRPPMETIDDQDQPYEEVHTEELAIY
ncbi:MULTISPECIES: O-antigen ligase family protein [unclassified Mucilaginibacter]|uniref:O-antigen ligase family protein n=1 Tax=unclassified Mucilaginibacter TaxID=2617802 RepID=UPI002AC8BE33|nr:MULTISPECIES: O-antigen ligase family protein [unclassified Mucilaginibacter]MEB0261129.1 O-antigen ligase family protein [Mucilaginibacter sp. 10I4]MEB0280504.1 O-antigen ligase family protein [Mucilaginibacter sp. 10B2]MEB0301290.1 O-antigen ligase family protein [Mucilaginibacter sp. 5C4]WPX22478.1 O-antigen ligase family protein [Mucilaginibacter sp. 5C4]